MSDELYKTILENQENQQIEQNETTEDTGRTWLVFKAGNNSYAIESFEVKEILRNNYVFPIPFVPNYVKGVLNYYGTPYAVIDFSQLQDYSPLDKSLFLVLKDENQFAFQISEIQEFHTEKDVSIQKIYTATDSGFFDSALIFNDVTAPILNLNAIIEKIKGEIENC